MGDENRKEEHSEQKSAQKSANGNWRDLLLYSGIAAAIISAAPQFMQIYQGQAMGVPTAEVPIAKWQVKAWERSGNCPIKTRSLDLSTGISVAIGACESTGDIRVRISNSGGDEVIRWIEAIHHDTKQAWLNHLIENTFSSAIAGPRAAQSNSDAVLCSRSLERGKILQRVREGGKCFDLIINIFTGKVLTRKASNCSPDCGG
ncbi:MAG: hypothetical protein ACWA5X_11640 [bacterium]